MALAAGLVPVPLLLTAAPALAAEEQRPLAVDSAAWSWRRVVPAGQPAGEPSNVPAGDLAVAFDGRPDAGPAKATYLRLALGDLPAGTTATALTLVLQLDPAVQQDATTSAVVACPLKAAFLAGEGVDPSTEPAEDCAQARPGSYDATAGTVSFPLTSLAVDWLSGAPNLGVVLRPDPAAALPTVLPFQLVFRGPATVVGRLTAVLPPAAPVLAPAPLPFEPGPAPAPVAQLPSLPLVPAPAPQAPVPAVVPLPTTAAPVAVPVAAAPVVTVSAVRAASRSSAAGLTTAAALGVLLLLVVSWASGEVADPRAFARAERRRLDRLRVAPVVPVVARRQPRQSRQGRKPLASATSTAT